MEPEFRSVPKTRPATEPGVEVLLVGPRSCAMLRAIEEALYRDGWPTARIGASDDLPGRVTSRRKAVVVVRTAEAGRALEVLESLEPKRSSTIVIVLVDRAEPGEYYCLSQAGAYAYFEVTEDLALIVQGVEWAARVLAP